MASEYPAPTSEAVSRVMRGNRKVDTRPEVLLRTALHARGMRYRKALLLTVGTIRVRPDIVFTRACVAVFLDGCFWHSCPEHGTTPTANGGYWRTKLARNSARDQLVDAALKRAQWSVVRVWEHETRASLADALQRVQHAVHTSPSDRAPTSQRPKSPSDQLTSHDGWNGDDLHTS